MKSRFLSVLFCALILAAAFLPGLPRQALGEMQQGKTAGEETQKKESFKEKRENYEKAAKEKLAGIETKIKELEAKAKEAGSKASDDAKKGLKELKHKKEVLKKDLAKLKASGKTKWEAVKKKVDSGMDDLEKTYDKVRDYFRSE